MAESLLAILLVTSSASAKGSSLVYRWPPNPITSPRLSRPLPEQTSFPSQLDNPWRAAHFSDVPSRGVAKLSRDPDEEDDYSWRRSDARHDNKSPSSSPSNLKGGSYNPRDEYDELLGYSSEFLATLLCPNRSMCHQKFELLVDDLAFLGHPVCSEDGGWRFRPEKLTSGSRGRESRNSLHPLADDSASIVGHSPEASPGEKPPPAQGSWLQTFHLVMVLDIPDPSSSASGNVSKYFDIIYNQISFVVTAVLFQEQVLSNFVEYECDLLGALKDSCIAKGEPYSNYSSQALEVSSIAPAMKCLYEAIKTSSMAYITIGNLPLELQLPPYLDWLLHSEDDNDLDAMIGPDNDDLQAWGDDMSFGWKLPALVPWKSLLLLDGSDGLDPYVNLRGPHVSPADKSLAEGLIKFLETASVQLSLADMATLLDWDLESQVFPTVRWLVQHRRAKVVDLVHPGLKTVFSLPSKFDTPLSKLTADFDAQFSSQYVPPLPRLLSTISTSPSKLTDNHFYASVVRSKELIPLYHDVVLWMLKRDMLITLHLSIRIVVPRKIKEAVELARQQAKAKKLRGRGGALGLSSLRQQIDLDEEPSQLMVGSNSGTTWLSLSPKSARRYSRQLPSDGSDMSELFIPQSDEEGKDEGDENDEDEDEDEDDEDEDEDEEDEWDNTEDNLWPSIIDDPGRATPLQRRWLLMMSNGKDGNIARRFQQINQYFDGKKSDDEILFRAEITRKQLREVLHHYEEYLQTFLHPS